MRKAFSVAALILALTCSTRAGWMPNGEGNPPPPPAIAAQMPATADEDSTGATDAITQIAFTLLASVLP